MLLNQPQSKLGQIVHKRWRMINRQANNWHAKAKRNFAHSLAVFMSFCSIMPNLICIM